MSLLRGLFWVTLFAFFTFCFVVLFEYGVSDFQAGFKTEFAKVQEFAIKAASPDKKDDKAKKK